MKLSKIIDTVKKYGLHPATKRELPLFTLSIITFAYRKLLKKEIGFSYQAIGAIGKRNKFHTLFNEDYIAEKTEKFIDNNIKNLDKVFDKAKRFFEDFKQKSKTAEKTINNNPESFIKIISKEYPKYMISIGIYNCFWRYLGDEEEKENLSSEQIKQISKEREVIAKFYPKVEKTIQSCAVLIGKKNNFNGDLLRYLTLDEMKSFLSKQVISKTMLEELTQRRKNYFYLSFDNKERVFTDNKIIKKIHEKFFKIDHKGDIIKGHPVYPGLVKEVVYNLADKKQINLKNNFILVTNMTHPDDTSLIGKCSAIVTDEGGILSHAATVSREMKKPCIIGTKIATKILKTGYLVEVNANKGIIRIIKKK